MTGNLKDYIKKSKDLNDGWSSAAVEGSDLHSPYGLPPFTPFHGLWLYMEGLLYKMSIYNCRQWVFVIDVEGRGIGNLG
jgi:hypothetical protein